MQRLGGELRGLGAGGTQHTNPAFCTIVLDEKANRYTSESSPCSRSKSGRKHLDGIHGDRATVHWLRDTFRTQLLSVSPGLAYDDKCPRHGRQRKSGRHRCKWQCMSRLVDAGKRRSINAGTHIASNGSLFHHGRPFLYRTPPKGLAREHVIHPTKNLTLLGYLFFEPADA